MIRPLPFSRRLHAASLRTATLMLGAVAVLFAVGCQNRSARNDASPSRIHLENGRKLSKVGNTLGARQEWTTAIALDPVDPSSYLAIADQEEAAGNYEAAARELEALRQAVPHASEVRCRQARLYRAENRFEKAFYAASEAIRSEPGCAAGHRTIALLLEESGQNVRAVEEILTARKLAPGDEATALDTARLLARTGRSREALALTEAQLKSAASSPQANYLMGWLLGEYGGSSAGEKALAYLEIALKQDPNNLPSAAEKGILLARLRRDAEAQKSLEYAVQHGAPFAETLAALAQVRMRLHRPDAARLAQAAAELQRLVQALQAARTHYLKSPSDTSNALALAALEAQFGNRPDAVDLVQQALRANPDDPAALRLLHALMKR